MEAVRSFEMSVNFYQTTRGRIPGGRTVRMFTFTSDFTRMRTWGGGGAWQEVCPLHTATRAYEEDAAK